MTDLQLIIMGIIKMAWLLLPILALFILWGLYEAIENKWERRVTKSEVNCSRYK